MNWVCLQNVIIQRCIFNAFILFFFITTGFVNATERITSFHADIVVHKNGSMTVDETIKVVVEGDAIKHGIVREFPTHYKDRFGNTHVVGFSVIRVERDRFREPYFIEHASNGERIFIGSGDTYVAHGEHTYRIRYNTDFQLGFFKEHDELYWNVTGNGWRFPIDTATALIHLPEDIPAQKIHAEAYTGPQGARGTGYTAVVNPDATVFFETRNLGRYEGFTIVTTWPKGFVLESTSMQKRYTFFKINGLMLAYCFWLLILILYSIIHMVIFYRKSKPCIIIPLFAPSEGLSPGAMRYVMQMKYDSLCFSSEIIQRAVIGVMAIKVEKHFFSTTYTLIKLQESDDTLVKSLFKRAKELVLSNQNRETLFKAIELFRKQLRSHDQYFERFPAKYVIAGFVFSGIVFFAVCSQKWISLELVHGYIFAAMAVLWVVYSICFVIACYLKRYTQVGQQVKAAIEGFKMFLSATETDRLRILSSPEQGIQEYERYLPYAIALGVEENWTKQFVPIFEQLARTGHAYMPAWYHGRHFNARHMGEFSRSVGSAFSGAISSAASAPGSRSGSGGRGSSGGGGGGGGGGGW